MVAFVDDQMAILANDIVDFALARQTLNDRNIDNAGRLAFAAADLTDGFGREIEKGGEPGDPLVEKLPAVDQNQRVGPAGGEAAPVIVTAEEEGSAAPRRRNRTFHLECQEVGKPALQSPPLASSAARRCRITAISSSSEGRGNVTTMAFRDYRSASQSRISGNNASMSASAASTSPGSGMAGNQPPGLG